MTGFVGRFAASFDRPVLVFALRTAVAACIALFLAWLCGLEHPQWSAMTVWAASQPARGQLLEKGLYRFAGTAAGVVAGMALVFLANGNILALVTGLAFWIALCTALGHLVRGFLVYGVILSGYSASMVALLDNGDPALVVNLGADRFLTISLGVAVALAVGLLFAPRGGPGALARVVRQTTSRLLALMARQEMARQESGDGEGLREETRQLLADIAGIEETLEPHGAGSRKARRFVRSARALFIAEVDLLLWLRAGGRAALPPQCRAALERAARALAREEPDAAILAALDQAADAGDDAARDRLAQLRIALADHFGAPERPESMSRQTPLVILHSDWRGARSAAVRALLAMLVVGAFWAFTGWHSGPFLLLGLSIMISLFSTFENPARFMRNVFLGQCIGVAGALACRWLVWPLVDGSALALVLAMIPFILLGAPIMAHGRTRLVGFDYNMTMLLLLQPMLPLKGDPVQWIGMGAAVVSAPLLGLVAYRLLPVDAGRRDAMLMRAMLDELKQMAAPGKPLNARVLRARLHHRLLRMVQLGEKAGLSGAAAADRGFAIYGLGEIVLRIRARAQAGEKADRGLDLVLARIADIDRRPERLAKALSLAADRLERTGGTDAAQFRAAAAAVIRQAPFFVGGDLRRR